MIQQDYILRIIREFMKALQLWMEKQRDIDQKQEKLLELYAAFVGDPVFYHTAPMEEVMESFTRWDPDERLQRMEMLAELYYAETSIKSGPTCEELLQRALMLFRFIDSHSRTYSIERQYKISKIEQAMNRFVEKNANSAE